MAKIRTMPCPKCGDAWVFASVGDYGSAYENNGYRINCKCGYAWSKVDWVRTKDEAVAHWNCIAKIGWECGG